MYAYRDRDFSLWSSFSVSFSILGLLPSIAATLTYDLGYSGPAGSVWGWIVGGILIQAVAFSMAELCSSMPTAGGLYYASAVLAPEGYGPLCSWVSLQFTSLYIMRTHKPVFSDNGLEQFPWPSDRSMLDQLRTCVDGHNSC